LTADLVRFNSPDLLAPVGAYVHAIVHGGMVYCSGQVGFDAATGTVVPGTGPQTRQALSNLAVVLAEAGSSLDRVVRASVYIRDAGMFAAMDAVFAEVFGSARPARTTLPGLQFRDGVDVEIDAIAAI
jgi:2-iminobutanoate/2-iminopropanoate deaminase